MIAFNEYDCVIGSRILDGQALKGGMPFYKYVSNRCLTFVQNQLLRKRLSEYHSGFRGFSKEVIKNLPLNECDDDFIFDNEMLAQLYFNKYKIGEISCPTKYFPEASSINFARSVKYGLGVLNVSLLYVFAKLGIYRHKIFKRNGKKLDITAKLHYYHREKETTDEN
ncbi:MAG: hypothetical protein PHV68_06790 [Candidatus Gastranaerophilales bacterium]|nr:hypothetical protein [Candidatus Gastranaerophilales bacterium]